MLQWFLALFFHDRHSQGELAAEGVFGASDLLSDLRCNGVHCWEQLWKRWKWSATHKGRRVGRTGFIVADIYLWTQTDITFDRQNGPWFPTQTVFSITHTFLSESSCQYPSFSPCLRIMLKGMIVLITDLLWHLLCALSYGATNAAVHCSYSTNAEFITMSFVCTTAPPTKYDWKGLTSEPYKPLWIGFMRQRRQG